MNATPEAMRLSKNQMYKETDAGGEAVSRGGSSEACLSFVSTGVGQMERGGIGLRERTCVAIDGRMGGRFRASFIYSYLCC